MEDGLEAMGAGAAVDVAGMWTRLTGDAGRAADTRPRVSAALPEADSPARGGVTELRSQGVLRLNSGSEGDSLGAQTVKSPPAVQETQF